jgi:pimeloyl-ACP methyl ester carboxylesterase
MILAAVAAVFLLSTIPCWYLQLATGFFSTRYFLLLGLLVFSAGSGAVLIITLSGIPASLLRNLALIAALFFTLMALGLIIIKLFARPGDRMRSLRALSRSLASFTSPVERFTVRSQDGVTVQAIRVIGALPRAKAVIVCHGGGRSKDIWANVITCELLAEEYDVFTFDWRGHQESDGCWTGDGASKYDLKAMIDHVRAVGYQRIGIVAWSFGAWTAIIEGAEYKNFDTLVAAAPPPTDMREVDMTRYIFAVAVRWWAWPVRIALKVLRNFRLRNYQNDISLEAVIAGVSPIPMLLVYNEFDTAIGMTQERFHHLFEQAGSPKRIAILNGRGHIYDWPNTLHYLNLVRDWLKETL